LYRPLQRAIYRTIVRIEPVHTFRRLPRILGRREMHLHMYPADHKNVILRFQFANGFRVQPALAGRDFTRLQRASEGSRKSTRRRGHDVVQRCRVRLVHPLRHLVMLGNGAMDAEHDRLFLRRQISAANRTLYALHPNI